MTHNLGDILQWNINSNCNHTHILQKQTKKKGRNNQITQTVPSPILTSGTVVEANMWLYGPQAVFCLHAVASASGICIYVNKIKQA